MRFDFGVFGRVFGVNGLIWILTNCYAAGWKCEICKGGVYIAQICALPEGVVFNMMLGLSDLYGSNRPCWFWQI
jgi:hypothetical protein